MKPINTALILLLLGIGSTMCLPSSANAKEITIDILEPLVTRGVTVWAGVKDYTATFVKRERVKGDLLEKETVFMKHRVTPRSVYMKWTKDPHEGRETLFVKGKNDNEIKAHEGGLLNVLNVNLDPFGKMAGKANRHTIYQAGIGQTVGLIAGDMKLARERAEGTFVDLGMKNIEGSQLHCYKATFPEAHVKKGVKAKKGKYYSGNIQICMDPKTGLPLSIEHRSMKGTLLEFYAYTNVKLNVGLTNKDFDPDNDAYGF
jgi:Protein of unknown function (DUF1571)